VNQQRSFQIWLVIQALDLLLQTLQQEILVCRFAHGKTHAVFYELTLGERTEIQPNNDRVHPVTGSADNV
jgi:hypothetical protein